MDGRPDEIDDEANNDKVMEEMKDVGSTFETNALLKAHGLKVDGPEQGWFLADDSGIEIDALDGRLQRWTIQVRLGSLPVMQVWNVTMRKITIRYWKK